MSKSDLAKVVKDEVNRFAESLINPESQSAIDAQRAYTSYKISSENSKSYQRWQLDNFNHYLHSINTEPHLNVSAEELMAYFFERKLELQRDYIRGVIEKFAPEHKYSEEEIEEAVKLNIDLDKLSKIDLEDYDREEIFEAISFIQAGRNFSDDELKISSLLGHTKHIAQLVLMHLSNNEHGKASEYLSCIDGFKGEVKAVREKVLDQSDEHKPTFRELTNKYLNEEFPREALTDKKGNILKYGSGEYKGQIRYKYQKVTDNSSAEWRNLELLSGLGLATIPVDSLAPRDFEKVFNILDYLPQKNPKKLDRDYEYAGFTLEQRLAVIPTIKAKLEQAGTDIDKSFETTQILYSTSSMKKVRQALVRFLKWHLGTLEAKYLVDAANTYQFEKRASARLPFTMDETKAIIKRVESERDDFKFFILTVIFTGFRPSELKKLKRVDVKIDSGIDYIYNKSGKSAAAKRQVPIHSYLKEKGFLSFVESKRGKVFDIPETTLKRLWGKIQEDLNIPVVVDEKEGKIKTLYSNRTSFNSRLELLKVEPDLRRLLMGHSIAGAQSSYSKQREQDFPTFLKNAAEAIDKIDF